MPFTELQRLKNGVKRVSTVSLLVLSVGPYIYSTLKLNFIEFGMIFLISPSLVKVKVICFLRGFCVFLRMFFMVSSSCHILDMRKCSVGLLYCLMKLSKHLLYQIRNRIWIFIVHPFSVI